VSIYTGIVCPKCGATLELPPVLGGLAIARALQLQFERGDLELACSGCEASFRYCATPPSGLQGPHFDDPHAGPPASTPEDEPSLLAAPDSGAS
jgi:hypothetical protein